MATIRIYEYVGKNAIDYTYDEILTPVVLKAMQSKTKTTLDFTDVEVYSSHFWAGLLNGIAKHYSVKEMSQYLSFRNIPVYGRQSFLMSIDAIRDYQRRDRIGKLLALRLHNLKPYAEYWSFDDICFDLMYGFTCDALVKYIEDYGSSFLMNHIDIEHYSDIATLTIYLALYRCEESLPPITDKTKSMTSNFYKRLSANKAYLVEMKDKR